jgi:anti-sigma-K factor RskA
MSAEEIIESGKLELYVCGALPQDESIEVEQAISIYPEVKREVESIEASLINLAEAVAPTLSAMVWSYILASIQNVRSIGDTKQSTNWGAITGWAAAILCIGGIFWMLNQNNDLQDNIELTTTENELLKGKLQNTETTLAETGEILEILRSKDYNTITLPGNPAVAPEAFAKVYFNKQDKVAYIDAKGLPTPTKGKVYQVWSLIMEPLTPSSIGLIGATIDHETGIYKFENVPDPQAFGITLEPEGGSETPSLDQLYTIGMVSSTP